MAKGTELSKGGGSGKGVDQEMTAKVIEVEFNTKNDKKSRTLKVKEIEDNSWSGASILIEPLLGNLILEYSDFPVESVIY